MRSIGFVKKTNTTTIIEILEEYADGLEGVEKKKHLWVLYEFHLASEKTKIHPLGCDDLPEIGVFASRSPSRPNRIGMSLVTLVKREGNMLYVKGLDALPETPILDIKPFAGVYDMPYGAVLPKQEIFRRIKKDDLVKDYLDLEVQLQASGFDLTLREIHKLDGNGTVDFDNSSRVIASSFHIPFEDDTMFLPAGYYKVIYNEVVKIPRDIMALGRPRSSLIRNGATILTAVWDPGYEGRSESGLVVYNPRGIRLKRNARILQLVFFKLTEETEEEYNGLFRGENI
jgi:dUTP pyrophosphatase